MKYCFTLLVLSFCFSFCISQEHEQNYFPVQDTLVQQKLEEWQDYKFGLLMHWGPYSQWGVVESWSICPEDEDWCRRRGEFANDYYGYVKAYEKLQTTFNPTKFDPDKWASAAKNAGMKYVVFTTKHHDGFCMFNSGQTDYTITNDNCPFSTNEKSNVTLEIFNAFRKQGIWTGAYFSKPDWHHPDYWDPAFPPYDRNPNYDPAKKTEKWKSYVEFTQNQILELLTDYGKVDLLWLDGGWVQPFTETSPKWGYKPMHQDIGLDSLVVKARKLQPGLIVVDRAVEGPNQNYLTPEQKIPGEPLPYPWESCMTMGDSWSYVPNDNYKSTKTLLTNLCLIVSRGGNYLLNVAPDANGEWDSIAYQRLSEIGAWMKINSEAIYNTKPVAPYEQETGSGKWIFTEGKQGEHYAIFIPDEKTTKTVKLDLSVFPDYRVRTATCLKNGTVTKVKGRYVELKTGGKGEILVWRLVG
jgi:alpha-L-fucosidase